MEDQERNSESEEEQVPWWASWWTLAGLCFFVVAAWITSWYVLIDNQDRGTFGDMFGAVNALFSGLAFAGVIFAIFLQRRELELQRKELKLTRTQLKRSAQAQELQSSSSQALLDLERRRRAVEYEDLKRRYDLNLEMNRFVRKDDNIHILILDNQGGPVSGVKLYTGEGVSVHEFDRGDRWYQSVGTISFTYHEGRMVRWVFAATYTNKFDQPRTKSFAVQVTATSSYKPDPEHCYIREIEVVDGEHPNHLDEIGEHVPDELRPPDA